MSTRELRKRHSRKSRSSMTNIGVRNINFTSMKKGDKLGISLGGEGHRQDVVSVREGTKAYWKGVEPGYKIVTVNGVPVDPLSVKSLLRDACTSGKGFSIGMKVGKGADDDLKLDKQASSNKGLSKRSDDVIIVNLWYHIPEEKEEKEESIPVVEEGPPIVDNGCNLVVNDHDVGFFSANESDSYEMLQKPAE